MAGLADLVQDLVYNLASPLTADFQGMITHYPWTHQSTDGFGEDFYASGVQYNALVDRTVEEKYSNIGELIITAARVTILDPMIPNGTSGRREPIDPRDKIVLDDGTTAPIVDLPKFTNPATGMPFVNEATIGKVVR